MKIKHLFLAAAALVVGFTSCSKDDNGKGLEGDFDFFMQVTQPDESLGRADAGQVVNNSEVTLEEGALFFIDEATDAITRYYRINPVSGGGAVTPDQLKAGHTFRGIPAASSKVIIVGNYSFDVATSLKTGADIEAITVDLIDQADAAYGVDNATLFGESKLVPATSAAALAVNATKEAKVKLGPIIARLEVVQVRGDNTIDGFTLAGIYIDDFYYTSSITGATYSNLEDIIYNGINSTPPVDYTDPAASYKLYSRATGYSTADWYPILFDDGGSASPGLGTTGSNGSWPANAVKATKGAWAYNFYPDAEYAPHIILHFKDLKVSYDGGSTFELYKNDATNVDGEAYLTINGYSRAGGAIALERSNVYVLNDVLFSDSDLREEPEQPDPDPDKNRFTVYVEVELMTWKVWAVEGEYN